MGIRLIKYFPTRLECYLRFLATQKTERPNGMRSPVLMREFSTESIQVRVLLIGLGRGLRSERKLSCPGADRRFISRTAAAMGKRNVFR